MCLLPSSTPGRGAALRSLSSSLVTGSGQEDTAGKHVGPAAPHPRRRQHADHQQGGCCRRGSCRSPPGPAAPLGCPAGTARREGACQAAWQACAAGARPKALDRPTGLLAALPGGVWAHRCNTARAAPCTPIANARCTRRPRLGHKSGRLGCCPREERTGASPASRFALTPSLIPLHCLRSCCSNLAASVGPGGTHSRGGGGGGGAAHGSTAWQGPH